MFYKVIELGSWNKGDMDSPVQMVKVSSRGLIGQDRVDFLKTASHVFADYIDNIKLASGEIPIHLKAIGATEFYGCNRNGDGFNVATCREHHPRFVKLARYYRNHKNKNPQKSYGYVKQSAYNPDMHRIELLVMGNETKEAAERNNGLVMLKESVDKLHRGEMIPFSMACKLAYDVCANCFNKAANRSQYCTEDTCISPTGRRGFGCANGLTKIAGDGIQQFVENPDPYFFDISEVVRPADFIAYGGIADYLTKAASDGAMLGGAQLAEMWRRQWGADFDLLTPEMTLQHQKLARQLTLARELAEIERDIESNGLKQNDLAYCRALKQSSLQFPEGEQRSEVLAALSRQNILLPIAGFMTAIKQANVDLDRFRQQVPGVFGRLVANAGLEDMLKQSQYIAEGLPSRQSRDWAEKQASTHSLEPKYLADRVFRQAIHSDIAPGIISSSQHVKTASSDDLWEKATRQYALYKLAALSTALEHTRQPEQLKRICILQNYVIC